MLRAVEAREGFGEYLAAGTALMNRWSVGDGPLFLLGQALICVAVDCRRAGHHKPVPTALLEQAHRHYPPAAWRHRDDLPPVRDALHWARQPVLGPVPACDPVPTAPTWPRTTCWTAR